MKKYLLIFLFGLFGTCFAQDFPETSFRSANTYNMGSGYTPQITSVGSSTIYGQETADRMYNPRRVPPADPEDPYMTPVGDIPWIVMISFVCVYLLSNKYKKE